MNIFVYEMDAIRISIARHGESLAASAAQRAFIALGMKETMRIFDMRPTGVEHIVERVDPCPFCSGSIVQAWENNVADAGVIRTMHECKSCGGRVGTTLFPPKEDEDEQH